MLPLLSRLSACGLSGMLVARPIATSAVACLPPGRVRRIRDLRDLRRGLDKTTDNTDGTEGAERFGRR